MNDPAGTPVPPRHDLSGLFHGVQFAVTAIVGLALGYWLDQKFGWTPLGTLGGLFGGAIAGFYSLYRAMK